MSSIKTAELNLIDEFLRGESKGYVLDFSNRTMGEFLQIEFDVDLYGGDYETEGSSKASHLRCFLKAVDDATAARALRRLSEYRSAMRRKPQQDTSPLAEGQVLAIVSRLESGGNVNGALPVPVFNRKGFEALRDQLNALWEMDPRPRGYAFEKYLKVLFDTFGLKARRPFSLTGEQIDGSFDLKHETYLLEAKWHQNRIGSDELRSFQGKVDDKAAWTRGLFVSFGGFTDVGLAAFGRGKKVICMDGQDMYEALDRNIPIDIVLERKVRHASETGQPFAPVADLFPTES